MKYFKDNKNTVYAYDDDADEKYIRPGLTEITEDEALVLVHPVPTHDELIEEAKREKQRRIDAANEFMNSKQLPGKAALERLSNAEKALYNEWLDYLDALEAVDTPSTPDINWPTPPEG